MFFQDVVHFLKTSILW